MKIFRHEFIYLIGRTATWLYLITLLSFTALMILMPDTGDGIYPNNNFLIFAVTIIGGLVWLMMSGSLAGEAGARDFQQGLYPLIYTSPVRKSDYLYGKFLAALAVNILLVISLPVGIILFFYLPGLDFLTGVSKVSLQAFNPGVYLRAFFIISLPLVFVGTSLQFYFAALNRRVMASFLASLLLAVTAQIVAISVAKASGNWNLAVLLDPVGITGLIGVEMQKWSILEKNTGLISLNGMFLWNRLLWCFIGAFFLWLTLHRFDFTVPVSRTWWSLMGKRGKADKTAPETVEKTVTSISVPQVQRSFTYLTELCQMLRISRYSFMKLISHPMGLSVILAISLISVAFASEILNEFGIPLIPTTQQVLNYLAVPVSSISSPWVVIPLLIIYFSGELIWLEREARFDELVDTAPVKNWILLIGKFIGIGMVIFLWMFIIMGAGILMQLNMDYNQLQIPLYLQTLFGLQLLDYLLFTLLSLVIHVVVNQKYLSFLVALLIFGYMAFPDKFGMEHPMLIFGADLGWEYTDMRGFGSSLGPWLWFKIYWMLWALLLAIAASLLWSRGSRQDWRQRLDLVKLRLSRRILVFSTVSAGLLLGVGGFIFYQTNILKEYLSSSEIVHRKANYEELYGRYRNTPQPQLTATNLHVELYPNEQRAQILGSYTLVNQESEPIDSIHIGSALGKEITGISFDIPAVAVLTDKRLSHHIYLLKDPLLPKDTLKIEFRVNYEHQDFTHSSIRPLVVDNGTHFSNFDLLPVIGYNRFREIDNPSIRKQHHLAPRPALPSLKDPEARSHPISTVQTSLETVIGTAKNEIAVAPGNLERTWEEDNRSYFHYKTNADIGGEFSILSADYKHRTEPWKDVEIRIFYYPGHAQNIDRMLHSVKASLQYYSAQFGEYPYSYLSLVEGAGSGNGASADAGIIYYGEQYALLNPDDGPDGFDLPYYIMAHEMAHQWWGIARLTPAYVEGAGVLVESLSVYAGMQVLQQTYGNSHFRKYISYLHDSYAMPRSLASASLLQADEAFLNYKKGGLAMYTLSEYVGRKKVNAALETLLNKIDSGNLRLPTTLDLYKELHAVTPDSLNYLLEDLFLENTYWRLKTHSVTAEKTTAGNWEVELEVDAEKLVVDRLGNEKLIEMNDWIEIGVYEEGKAFEEPLYLEKHRVRSGMQIIRVMVARKPRAAGIDPNQLMIDLRLDDNMKEIN